MHRNVFFSEQGRRTNIRIFPITIHVLNIWPKHRLTLEMMEHSSQLALIGKKGLEADTSETLVWHGSPIIVPFLKDCDYDKPTPYSFPTHQQHINYRNKFLPES